MIKFLTIFSILAIIGFALLEWQVLLPAINLFCLILAKISGFFIQLFDNNLIISGIIIQHEGSHFGLEVAKECSGLTASWLLLAAIVAFESNWKHKLWGILAGFLIIQFINIIRIISLFYIGDNMFEYFELAHRQIWPIILNISMIFIFGGWLYYTITHSISTAD
ncbi:MAG: exosortase H [Candidatus Parabeggiatoa sp.]|nr:exosortase H [Candidatus Parabeggiatoa sp.]